VYKCDFENEYQNQEHDLNQERKKKGRSIIEKRKPSSSVPFSNILKWDFAQKKDDIMKYIIVTRSYLEIYTGCFF